MSDISKVRVRFCPSPTGTPHVGLVRTALFNWAYARNKGGKFVFRIEDTDPARDSEESFTQLVSVLKWLGLDWDEGVDIGGEYAPYRQSERGDIYQNIIKKLLESGHIYESYSSVEDITKRRLLAGEDPKLGYDNFDRNLTESDKIAYKQQGIDPVLRLKMPAEDIVFKDMVRGEIVFKSGDIPDFVIVRANGKPLYTLVNPVDDALMKITHIFRGEDLLSSTPRQIALYKALIDIGVAEFIPQFGHLPYVMGTGNKKLSKRDPSSSIFLYKDRGFIPEGLLNYLSLLGWSLSPDRDIFSMEELIAAFDIASVNPNPARFDLKKAEAINSSQIRLLSSSKFYQYLLEYLQQSSFFDTQEISVEDKNILREAAPLVQERIICLADAANMLAFLFKDDDKIIYTSKLVETLPNDSSVVLDEAIKALDKLNIWSAPNIQEILSDTLVSQMGLKPRVAFGAIRLAVSGNKVSPPLFESLAILGKDSSLTRIRSLRTLL